MLAGLAAQQNVHSGLSPGPEDGIVKRSGVLSPPSQGLSQVPEDVENAGVSVEEIQAGSFRKIVEAHRK